MDTITSVDFGKMMTKLVGLSFYTASNVARKFKTGSEKTAVATAVASEAYLDTSGTYRRACNATATARRRRLMQRSPNLNWF